MKGPIGARVRCWRNWVAFAVMKRFIHAICDKPDPCEVNEPVPAPLVQPENGDGRRHSDEDGK